MWWPELGLRRDDVRGRLASLRDRPLNFDPCAVDGPDWHRDDYRQPLPPERPGPPEPGGSFEAARALSRDYAFADPALVEASFDAAAPLEERDMLLVLHALGVGIYAGVRVGDAREETLEVDGRPAQVSSWNYRTLEGHVEAGQRDFEVWKWLDTGEVEFRTHARSRAAGTNPLVRLGFLLLGRHKQVEFGRGACRRMALLTAAALRRADGSAPARTFDGRLLGIYLRDHHALLVAERELAARVRDGSPSAEERAFGAALYADATNDLSALEALLAAAGSAPSRTKEVAVRAAERLARLKLNGRLTSRSPFSSVTELEGCRLLLESARSLWAGMARLGLGPADASERSERAAERLDVAERLRLGALEAAATARTSGGTGRRAG